MKEVCRLGKRSIDVLSMYHDDANEAIMLMQDALMRVGIELEKERAVTKALQGVGAGVPVIAPTAVNVISAREKFMSTPVPDSGVPVMFNDAFWKKFRAEVVGALEPISGRGY